MLPLLEPQRSALIDKTIPAKPIQEAPTVGQILFR